MRGKTICFIDDSNVFHGSEEAGWRVDWKRFHQYLSNGDQEVWQTYFFTSDRDPEAATQTGFYHFLKNDLRFEIELYSLGRRTERCDACGHSRTVPVEKGVDVGLAVKMLMLGMSKAYETAILVAGDRDYLETVKNIKAMGLRVEVVAWKKSCSNELATESSSPVLYLDDLREHIEKSGNGRHVSGDASR